jgi:hypothetical protein
MVPPPAQTAQRFVHEVLLLETPYRLAQNGFVRKARLSCRLQNPRIHNPRNLRNP